MVRLSFFVCIFHSKKIRIISFFLLPPGFPGMIARWQQRAFNSTQTLFLGRIRVANFSIQVTLMVL